MPLYDYACTQCGKTHEVRHGFDETHRGVCEACGAPLRRVFNPAPVLFKGSGFYVTDSRKSSGSAKAGAGEKSGEATGEKPEKAAAPADKPKESAKPQPSEPAA